MGRYERPLKLKTNKIPYLIPGGGMIDRFLGEEGRSTASQMWIASVVQCTLDGSRDSRSYIEEGTEEVCLADEIAREPWLYLGKAFHDKYGSNLGFLLKLLNSRDRLLVQTHPDKERAQKYFGSRFGKTESWYVVDTEPGKEAYIWAGFRQGVTREGFLDLIRKQDTEVILGCLHRFVITPGDVIFIKAGLPHALGADSLVAEIQEPTDITLRAERFRPDGSELPEISLHSGIGYEGLLDCFAFEPADQETVRERIFLKKNVKIHPWGEERNLIGYETTEMFAMKSVLCHDACERENHVFMVGLVLKGNGWVEYGDHVRIPVKKGTELFIPHGVKHYRYIPEENMEVLECYPPQI